MSNFENFSNKAPAICYRVSLSKFDLHVKNLFDKSCEGLEEEYQVCTNFHWPRKGIRENRKNVHINYILVFDLIISNEVESNFSAGGGTFRLPKGYHAPPVGVGGGGGGRQPLRR